jgi:hypothetical protein
MRPARLIAFPVLVVAVVAGASPPAGSTLAPREHGSAVVLEAATGREVARLSANGAVVAAVADGHGGWFVGGSFTLLAGQKRVAIAHVLPSGRVDPAWRASIGSASGRPVAVYALARAGNRLFVAGPFGRVGGLQRPGLAALDTRTGAVLPHWLPRPHAADGIYPWWDVQVLAVTGGRLLVARNWSYPVAGITALRVRTATVDWHWNPHLRLIGDAGNFSSLLPSRSRVYVAGAFHVHGLRRNGLVALTAKNGKPDRRWAPQPQNCRYCNGFAQLYGIAASERRIYVSGAFAHIDGVKRDGIAALDPRTGAVDMRWQPAHGRRDIIRLALSGSRLYLGTSDGLRALDAGTGAAIPLPRNHEPDEVLALASSAKCLLVAGRD